MSLSDNSGEYLTAVSKATPPVAVTSAAVVGMTLQDWVLIATLVYTVLQTALLIYKFVKDRKNGSK